MNVKGKTIFDFCKDAEMRKAIIGGDYTEKDYKSLCHEIFRYDHIRDFAARTNNRTLFEAATKARDEAQSEFDERANEGMRNGIIID